MLGAVEANISAFLEEVKQHVRNGYSLEVWRESVRDGLATDARAVITEKLKAGEVVAEADLSYFAEQFYGYHYSRIERAAKRLKARNEDKTGRNFSSPAHGSLQNIAAYATLLPPAIRARESILGQREPFSYDEAVAWLEREAECGEHLAKATITFELRLPTEEPSPIEL